MRSRGHKWSQSLVPYLGSSSFCVGSGSVVTDIQWAFSVLTANFLGGDDTIRGYHVSDWRFGKLSRPKLKRWYQIRELAHDNECEHHVSARRIGPVANVAWCSPDTLDTLGIINGLENRVLIQPPFARPWFHRDFHDFVLDQLLDVVPSGQPLSFEDWLSQTNYNESRKEQLRLAHEEGEKPESWSKCKSFIKREFYMLFKPFRTINSRVDNYKAFAGPWFAWLEHDLIGQIPSFVKGLTPHQRAVRAEEMCRLPIKYVSDFSRFESQITREVMLSCEILLYRHYGIPEKYLLPLYGVNRLHFRNVKASVLATRMSGDMCTSIGNGFTNLMVNKYVAEMNGSEISGVVEGDDGLFSVSRMPTAADFASCGFKMEVKRVESCGMAGFCSSFWDEDCLPVVNPVRHLIRLGWSFTCPKNAGQEYRQALLRAKCNSLVDLANGCPLLWCVAYWFQDSGKVLFTEDWKKTVNSKLSEAPIIKPLPILQPTSLQRERVADLFGISRVDQLRFEEMVKKKDLSFLEGLVEEENRLAGWYKRPENEYF